MESISKLALTIGQAIDNPSEIYINPQEREYVYQSFQELVVVAQHISQALTALKGSKNVELSNGKVVAWTDDKNNVEWRFNEDGELLCLDLMHNNLAI